MRLLSEVYYQCPSTHGRHSIMINWGGCVCSWLLPMVRYDTSEKLYADADINIPGDHCEVYDKSMFISCLWSGHKLTRVRAYHPKLSDQKQVNGPHAPNIVIEAEAVEYERNGCIDLFQIWGYFNL